MEQSQRPRPLNILLVDDDEVDAITVRRAFTKANIECQLVVVRNGIEALEILRGKTFPTERRLVLLDINMPKMNGIELLRELRTDRALHKLTVIMMTTSSEENDRIEAYQLNVAGKARISRSEIESLVLCHAVVMQVRSVSISRITCARSNEPSSRPGSRNAPPAAMPRLSSIAAIWSARTGRPGGAAPCSSRADRSHAAKISRRC